MMPVSVCHIRTRGREYQKKRKQSLYNWKRFLSAAYSPVHFALLSFCHHSSDDVHVIQLVPKQQKSSPLDCWRNKFNKSCSILLFFCLATFYAQAIALWLCCPGPHSRQWCERMRVSCYTEKGVLFTTILGKCKSREMVKKAATWNVWCKQNISVCKGGI